MKYAFLLLFFPFAAGAQLIKRSTVDTSRKPQIETAAVNLKTSTNLRVDAVLLADGGAMTLQLAGNGFGGTPVLAGDRAIFLLQNDSTVTVQASATQPTERRGGTAFRYNYAVDDLQLAVLARNPLKAVRTYIADSYEDIYLDKPNTDKLKELSAAFLQELQKTGVAKKSAPPSFPGGKATLLRFLNRNLGLVGGLEGAERKFALVQFTVGADGSLGDYSVTRSAGAAFDEEILRLLKRMPNWKPATANGQPVASIVRQPFTFLRSEGKVSVQF